MLLPLRPMAENSSPLLCRGSLTQGGRKGLIFAVETFDHTYREYLLKLKQIDLVRRADALQLQFKSGRIMVPFFGCPHYIAKQGVGDFDDKTPTPAVATVLLSYVLRNERIRPPAMEKISFKDFKGAGPLVTSFANNTNRLIERTFAGRMGALEAACRHLGGVSLVADPVAVDLSVKFEALPRVPLYLSFNDQDEDFPAQCNLLFEKSAEQYLDSKSLFALGTFLAGRLIMAVENT
jgi:hypothetical protein